MADHDGHTITVNGPVTVGITGEVDPDRLLRLYAAEVDRLRAMVLKHGDHTPACRYRRAEGDGRHCLPSCGWDTSDHDGHTIDAGPVTVGTCGCSNNFGHTCEEVDRLRAENAALERKLNAALVDVVNMANQETSAALADEEALDGVRADNAALAAALEDIAGMLDWNRLESGQPEDWRATAECAGMNHVCHVAHPGDPVEWCGVCVAEVAWCAWKMGVLG